MVGCAEKGMVAGDCRTLALRCVAAAGGKCGKSGGKEWTMAVPALPFSPVFCRTSLHDDAFGPYVALVVLHAYDVASGQGCGT